MQMSKEEICASFRQAKKQNKQIEILADLNTCSTAEILEILESGGCISGLPLRKQGKTAKPTAADERKPIEWTVELDKQLIAYCEAEKKPREIAELMNLSVVQVKNRKAKLKNQGYIFDRPNAVVDKTDAPCADHCVAESGGCVVAKTPVLNPIQMMYDTFPSGLNITSATVKFEDEVGNVWRMELSKEAMSNGKA